MAGPGVAGTFLGTQVPDLEDRPLCRTGAHWAVGQHVDVKNHPTVMTACSPQQMFAEYPPSPGLGGARGRGRCCLTLAGWVSVVPSALEWALRTPPPGHVEERFGEKSPIASVIFHGSLWSPGAPQIQEK